MQLFCGQNRGEREKKNGQCYPKHQSCKECAKWELP